MNCPMAVWGPSCSCLPGLPLLVHSRTWAEKVPGQLPPAHSATKARVLSQGQLRY